MTKTVTLAPRQGNPPPRLYELPGGLLNSIGLPNKGLDAFLQQDLPQLAELPVPLIVNVMGGAHDEVAELVERVGERDEVTALELNVSCPNVKTGLMFGADPGEVARAARRGSSPVDQTFDRQADAQLRRRPRTSRRPPSSTARTPSH